MARAAAIGGDRRRSAAIGGWGSGEAAARVTVLAVVGSQSEGDAADDNGGDLSSGEGAAAIPAATAGAGGDDSGSHEQPPHLLDAPVTAGEVLVRHMGLDGVVLRGHHIRQMRLGAGLSVMELAERLSFSRSQVHRWECGEASCPSYVLPQLIAAIEGAREEREALLRRARLHLVRWDEEEGGGRG